MRRKEGEVVEEQSLQVRTRSRVGSWGQVGHKVIGEEEGKDRSQASGWVDGVTVGITMRYNV